MHDYAVMSMSPAAPGEFLGAADGPYAPHCDLVRECRTLTQLAEVVDGLVQGLVAPAWRRALAARAPAAAAGGRTKVGR